jgi:hypothetical protein
MKQSISTPKEFSKQNDAQIKQKEKKLEISIYALLIIVTIALMLLIFNLFLLEK